jgi:hypothetical protein
MSENLGGYGAEAAAKSFSLIKVANFALPATFVRSPMFVKLNLRRFMTRSSSR